MIEFLNEIIIEGRVFKFYNSCILNISKNDDGLYEVYNKELDIYGYGETKLMATQDFNELIINLWDNYGLCENKNLTSGAIELKNKILEVYKEVV